MKPLCQIEEVKKQIPLEVKLRHLESLSQSIADDFNSLKERGKETRATNGRWMEQCLVYMEIITWAALYGFTFEQQFSPLCDLLHVVSETIKLTEVLKKRFDTTYLFPILNRLHQYPSAALQHHLHVPFECTGHVASFLFQTILQGKEADRVNAEGYSLIIKLQVWEHLHGHHNVPCCYFSDDTSHFISVYFISSFCVLSKLNVHF